MFWKTRDNFKQIYWNSDNTRNHFHSPIAHLTRSQKRESCMKKYLVYTLFIPLTNI
jgi:hypothetical protein